MHSRFFWSSYIPMCIWNVPSHVKCLFFFQRKFNRQWITKLELGNESGIRIVSVEFTCACACDLDMYIYVEFLFRNNQSHTLFRMRMRFDHVYLCWFWFEKKSIPCSISHAHVTWLAGFFSQKKFNINVFTCSCACDAHTHVVWSWSYLGWIFCEKKSMWFGWSFFFVKRNYP